MLYALFTRLMLPLSWWGRTRVHGLEAVPRSGPLLLVPNHDSQMDPVLLAVVLRRVRPLRFLARADLWKMRGLGPILNGMRQIPIERGSGDSAALDRAVEALRGGEAICIFPEGKLSNGERLKARSGVGRLAAACPRRGWCCARSPAPPTSCVFRAGRASASRSSRPPRGSCARTSPRRSWRAACSVRSGQLCRPRPPGRST